MHKNNYTAKTLNGNWNENRFTDHFDDMHNQTSNTYLPNPCKSPPPTLLTLPLVHTSL